MTNTEIAVDRNAVEDSFRAWQDDQSLLEAELIESVAALDAYQSHLDAWQQDLAHERQQLREEREAFNRDRSSVGANPEQLQVLAAQLEESREKINSLTSALLQRTEELRNVDQQRDEATKELATVRTHEKELTLALESQQQKFDAEHQQWEHETARLRELAEKGTADVVADATALPLRNGPVKSEPRTSTSPVLGSVMEQFGKLRQQRSLNRPNPKPR